VSIVPPVPPGSNDTGPATLTPAMSVWSVPASRLTAAAPVAPVRPTLSRDEAPLTFQFATPGTLAALAAVPFSRTVPALTLKVLLTRDLSEPLVGAGPESPDRTSVPAPSFVMPRCSGATIERA
jgi:hypothetical protein